MKGRQRYRNYKSPVGKLVGFYEGSRNRWKTKYKKAKKHAKRLHHRVRVLGKSKARLERRARELEAASAQTEAVNGGVEHPPEIRAGVPRQPYVVPGAMDSFQLVPRHHHYSVGLILGLPLPGLRARVHPGLIVLRQPGVGELHER